MQKLTSWKRSKFRVFYDSIGSSEPMLRSHLTICLNVGLTPEQLQQFVIIIKSTIGKKEVKSEQKVLNEVIKTQKTR